MKRYFDRRFFGVVAALLLLTTFSLAQAAEVREGVLDSKLTARKMPYRVVVPPGYDAKENASKRYPVIYLLHGLTGHYDNWTTRTKIAEYAAGYGFIIVCGPVARVRRLRRNPGIRRDECIGAASSPVALR